jgi:hypothetical protein
MLAESGADSIRIYPKSPANQRSEAVNSHFAKFCSKPYLAIFRDLRRTGLFISGDPIDMACLLKVFRPLFKAAVDKWKHDFNHHIIRFDRNAQFSGASPHFFYNASGVHRGQPLPEKQYTSIEGVDLDAIAQAVGIPDWTASTDTREPFDQQFELLCQAVMPNPPLLNTARDTYLQLRQAWTKFLEGSLTPPRMPRSDGYPCLSALGSHLRDMLSRVGPTRTVQEFASLLYEPLRLANVLVHCRTLFLD